MSVPEKLKIILNSSGATGEFSEGEQVLLGVAFVSHPVAALPLAAWPCDFPSAENDEVIARDKANIPSPWNGQCPPPAELRGKAWGTQTHTGLTRTRREPRGRKERRRLPGGRRRGGDERAGVRAAPRARRVPRRPADQGCLGEGRCPVIIPPQRKPFCRFEMFVNRLLRCCLVWVLPLFNSYGAADFYCS